MWLFLLCLHRSSYTQKTTNSNQTKLNYQSSRVSLLNFNTILQRKLRACTSSATTFNDYLNNLNRNHPPLAVSPLNMTQSAPSKTALATSLASARVGLGLETMDSSIWVAQMTGLPFKLHFADSIFCAMNTCVVDLKVSLQIKNLLKLFSHTLRLVMLS